MNIEDCVVAYLGGDSFPGDSYIETEVRRQLPGRFIDHLSILTTYQDGRYISKLARRLSTLRQLSDDLPEENLVLIGRSSGGRVITLHAGSRPPRLRGLICLGYPFKHPKRPPDPERVAHLADLAVPTLILQGNTDHYGGADAAARYALSPHIMFKVVRAAHNFRVGQDVWNEIGQHMRGFIQGL